MKITMYELLGMIMDGKAPKRIRFLNHYYMWKENDEDYQKEDGLMLFGNIKINYILNSEVEILEEKKIPGKINNWTSAVGRVDDSNIEEYVHKLFEQQTTLYFKFNSIIDYLKKEGNK